VADDSPEAAMALRRLGVRRQMGTSLLAPIRLPGSVVGSVPANRQSIAGWSWRYLKGIAMPYGRLLRSAN